VAFLLSNTPEPLRRAAATVFENAESGPLSGKTGELFP
jgi:hypothetical protein